MIQRWCVHTLKRNNDGPLAQSQSNFWKKMYSQWHKSSRQPSSNFSGDRFPAFAMSLARNRKTRRFERFQADRFRQRSTAEEGHAVRAVQAAVWANCSHTPDCTTKIDDQGLCSLLGLHIVVQNYGQVPILLSPHDIILRLKTGATCRPCYSTSTSPSRSNDAPAFLALSRDGHVCEEAGELAGLTQVVLNQVAMMVCLCRQRATSREESRCQDARVDGSGSRFTCMCAHGRRVVYLCPRVCARGRRVEQWDFAVLGTCYFPLPMDVRFEPDALETCEELVVGMTRADSSGDQHPPPPPPPPPPNEFH